jgi:carboxyl-terminal processing protease
MIGLSKSCFAASRLMRRLAVCALIVAVQGCGGGSGGGGSAVAAPPPPAGNWNPGVFLPASSFAAQCATPRTGTDPFTDLAYPDVQGSVVSENNWLRSWSHDLYLWYDEIVDRNPANYTTPAYFDLMRTTATTPSGRPKDRFHFTYPTDQWLALSRSGQSAGYGAQWAILAPAPPRDIRVAYTHPDSPAADHGIARGARVIAIDGINVVNSGGAQTAALLNDALFPAAVGQVHTFEIQDPGATTTRLVTLVSETVTTVPVQSVSVIETGAGRVGYMFFTDHIATAEQALLDAFTELEQAGIDDLVIDLRYNGGGFLAIAAQVAYMVAGSAATAGRTFESMQFNDKHPTTNPVTGAALGPLPFLDFTLGLTPDTEPLQPLPSLNLPRVFVLTGGSTCSASESMINGLRGIDIEVIQIGNPTCGKPYGFYPEDNCGTTYFSIQLRVVNEKGFGDYADGFSPDPGSVVGGAATPGCLVNDDFNHPLGSPSEARLAAALHYRASGTCPAAFASGRSATTQAATPDDADAEPLIPKPPTLTNRIFQR